MPKSASGQHVCCQPKNQSVHANSAVYFLAWIGALVYFWQQAPTLSDKVVAFLKACVWPALLVYHALQFLKIS